MALQEHYNGPGEVEKRIRFTKRELELAHYWSEKTFTFEKYVTKDLGGEWDSKSGA